MRKIKFNDIVIRIILLMYSIIVIYPVLWTALTSLKTNKEFYKSPWALPETFQWSNYVRAWVQVDVSVYFKNSVFVTLICIIITALLAATTGYVLSRFNFKFNKVLNFAYVSGIMVPGVLTIIPSFFLLQNLRLYNSLSGLSAIYIAWTLPFSITVMMGFFKTIQHEMEEAALIDGCGYFRTFWSIMLPLAKPGIITINIFNFLFYWNEFILALTLVTDKKKTTLPVGMQILMSVAEYRTDWGALFAGLMIVMIPTIVFYVIFENQISEGLSAGAVKG